MNSLKKKKEINIFEEKKNPSFLIRIIYFSRDAVLQMKIKTDAAPLGVV